MDTSQFSRSQGLVGDQQKLFSSHVAVFGLGGVGSYAVEALCRMGVGHLTLVDDDVVAASNLNRQLYALHSTLGQPKVQVAKRRIADIFPECTVDALLLRLDETTLPQFDFAAFDYVVDAIDTVTSKVALITGCLNAGTPVISCMGTGNKLHPELLRIGDISQTSVCPLARTVRKLLKQRGITSGVKVVYSTEAPASCVADSSHGRHSPCSVSFVPSVAGLMIAGEVIRSLTGQN